MQRFIKILASAVLLAVVAWAGFRLGQVVPEFGVRLGLQEPSPTHREDVIRYLEDHYAIEGEDGSERFSEKNLDRMLQAMDPYSGYLSKEEFSDFEKETSQRYVGIGVQIARLERGVVITRVFPNSPAEEVGLRPGDEIVAVGGRSARDAGINRVVKRISGPAGTRVRIEVVRRSADERLTVFPTRRRITYSSVETAELLEDGVAYIKISEFGQRTGDEFRRALKRLKDEGMRSLVLDLRNNPGGLLTAAVAVAEPFFAKGERIVEVKGFGIGEDEAYVSSTPQEEGDYPIVVLLNRGSASASEIVAGSLRSTGRALIVGEKSYGKGTVQSIFALSNGEGLRMTTAHYYLPDGTPIEDGVGLEPDVPVLLSYRDTMRLQLQDYHTGYLTPDEFEERFGFAPVEDRQLGAAIEILRDGAEG